MRQEMDAGEDDVASNDRGTITSNILSSMLLGASTVSAGAPNNGKDKVVDQLLRALKLVKKPASSCHSSGNAELKSAG